MKKIVRLTESELKNIVEKSVRRAIKEGVVDEGKFGDIAKTAALGTGLGLGAAGLVGTDNPVSRSLDRQFADQEEVGRAFPEDREEFGDKLNPQKSLPADTIGWPGVHESRIRRAVMESLVSLMKECDGNSDKLADRNKAFNRLSHLDINTKDEDDNKEALRMRKHYIKGQRK